MTEHVHEWYLMEDGPECDECQYRATTAMASCKCGRVLLGPSAIERRLNATERLSMDAANAISEFVHSPLDYSSDSLAGRWAAETLEAYAAALERAT